jgi:hypothetical protein
VQQGAVETSPKPNESLHAVRSRKHGSELILSRRTQTVPTMDFTCTMGMNHCLFYCTGSLGFRSQCNTTNPRGD